MPKRKEYEKKKLLLSNSFFIVNYLRSCNCIRTQATRANIHTLMSAVYNCLYLSDIRLPSAICLSVRVRYFQTESNALTADFTFCHFADTSYMKPFCKTASRFSSTFAIITQVFHKIKWLLQNLLSFSFGLICCR